MLYSVARDNKIKKVKVASKKHFVKLKKIAEGSIEPFRSPRAKTTIFLKILSFNSCRKKWLAMTNYIKKYGMSDWLRAYFCRK